MKISQRSTPNDHLWMSVVGTELGPPTVFTTSPPKSSTPGDQGGSTSGDKVKGQRFVHFLRQDVGLYHPGNSPQQLLILDSHVALVGVDPVKQGLRCHPLDGQSALQAARGRWGGPGQAGVDAGLDSAHPHTQPVGVGAAQRLGVLG